MLSFGIYLRSGRRRIRNENTYDNNNINDIYFPIDNIVVRT